MNQQGKNVLYLMKNYQTNPFLPTYLGNYCQMARQARPLEDQHHQCLSPSLDSLTIAVFLIFSGTVKNKETELMNVPYKYYRGRLHTYLIII